MIDKQFDKETFKKSVKDNVKFLYRRKLEEATQDQLLQAVSYTVKDVIIDNWLDTQNAYEEQDPKIVYYMSMEFLMGRALGNNLLNLGAYGEVKEALEELGIDINALEDQAKYIDKLPEDFNIPNIMFTTYFVHYKEKVQFIDITFKPRQGGTNSINVKKIVKIGWKAVKDFYKLKKEL